MLDEMIARLQFLPFQIHYRYVSIFAEVKPLCGVPGIGDATVTLKLSSLRLYKSVLEKKDNHKSVEMSNVDLRFDSCTEAVWEFLE